VTEGGKHPALAAYLNTHAFAWLTHTQMRTVESNL